MKGGLLLLAVGAGAVYLYVKSQQTSGTTGGVIPLPSSGTCPTGYTAMLQCSPVSYQGQPTVCVPNSLAATYCQGVL